jgi:hypothetical protein
MRSAYVQKNGTPNERNMIPGQLYSVDKHKRWEVVEDLKKDSEVVVAETTLGRKEQFEVVKAKKKNRKKKDQLAAQQQQQQQIIQTRKGPKVKVKINADFWFTRFLNLSIAKRSEEQKIGSRRV